MSPHNNFKGPEHARPLWALQVLGIVGGLVGWVFGLGCLFGWW